MGRNWQEINDAKHEPRAFATEKRRQKEPAVSLSSVSYIRNTKALPCTCRTYYIGTNVTFLFQALPNIQYFLCFHLQTLFLGRTPWEQDCTLRNGWIPTLPDSHRSEGTFLSVVSLQENCYLS